MLAESLVCQKKGVLIPGVPHCLNRAFFFLDGGACHLIYLQGQPHQLSLARNSLISLCWLDQIVTAALIGVGITYGIN